ncbi:MAG: NADH:flavin oxidoreductase [Verrucomicrobiales bacterium]|nr:NADH:flavin oxidoreductase [Verrucomicrobiales bacterium]
MPVKLIRIPSLKSAAEFQAQVAGLEIQLPCDPSILTEVESPLSREVSDVRINGKTLFNRWVVHPMEGWDADTKGRPTEDVHRRWQRFGESGACLIFGGEAMAVRADGRANPNQLILSSANASELARLREGLVKAHHNRHGSSQTPVIGFQLTHSGRFCRPNDKKRFEPRVGFRHPLLDARFGVTQDDQVFTDNELDDLIGDFVRAARVAWDAGADFVDIKHCHGYLLHELLGAHHRPGRYGGSFENRTRMLREIAAGIRADGNPIELGVRLSAFDFVPFVPDPAQSQPGRPGPGIPAPHSDCLPYRYAFGVREDHPIDYDLAEPCQFVDLCASLGIKLLNLSAGSPYYNPHIQRPAAYPPSDGYQPPEDPLVGVARQLKATRFLRQHLQRTDDGADGGRRTGGPPPVVIGTGYSYLQEFLPHVAQAAVREGWTDMVGLGRMILSYPELPSDSLKKGSLATRLICRTFSDCTTAPRNGLPSGCYPLDEAYKRRPEAKLLRDLKRASIP